jgi:O-antigen/teichoic acid export membrane protein
MILWASLGMFFKTASWAVSFLFLAKGAAKIYFINEFVAQLLFLSLNMSGYYLFGLTGLGISFLLGYILYLIQSYAIITMKFKLSFKFKFITVFLVQFIFAICCFSITKFLSPPISYLLGTLLVVASIVYSAHELDKMIGIKVIVNKYFHKNAAG